MRPQKLLPTVLVATVLLLVLAGTPAAEDELPAATLPVSSNGVIKLGDAGLSPSVLEMRREDSLVLFLNDSAESLVTLQINFGTHASHCASENLTIGPDGVIRSSVPIAPKDFATACFHDPGSYSYTAFGLKRSPGGAQGTIVVK